MFRDKCGTYAGFSAHSYKKEYQCEPCLVAGREYQRKNKTARRDARRPEEPLPTVIRKGCGTSGGEKTHRYHFEIPCEPCRIARRASDVRRNAEKPKPTSPKSEPITRPQCGTPAGAKMHQKKWEQTCDPCRLAHNAKCREEYDPEKDKEIKKAYRAKNREKARQVTAQWRFDNPGKAAEAAIRWRINNPEKAREVQRSGSAKRRALEAQVVSEKYELQDILDTWGTDCHICQEPVDFDAPRHSRHPNWERGLHLDHVIPLSRGGSNTVANVKPSHARCNLLKNNKVPTSATA